jgi:hypothetical protein
VRIPLRATNALVISAAIALVASACTVGAETGEDAADATIGFVSPSDGAAISVPFDVELEASEPLDEPATGNRHAHIYFDTSTDSADYDIVYGTTAQVTRDLAPGEHTLTVALANPDHSLVGVWQEITVTVGEGEGSADDGATDAGTEPSATPPPAFDY